MDSYISPAMRGQTCLVPATYPPQNWQKTANHMVMRKTGARSEEYFVSICVICVPSNHVIHIQSESSNLLESPRPLNNSARYLFIQQKTRHKRKKPRHGYTEQTNRHYGCHFGHWAAAYALIVKVRRHQNHRGGQADAPHPHRHEYHPV